MRILTKTQGTDEWEVARKGRVTASCIGKTMAGANTKGRYEYMLQLVLDLEGISDFRDSAPWFLEGRKYEQHARGWYQWEKQIDVTQVGFVLHDDYNWLGASPDGLLGDDGNLEIKYRKNLTTFNDTNHKPIPRLYMYQMQIQMEVCNRAWTDYVNYWRDDNGKEQGQITRIERDDGLIREGVEAALVFWRDTIRLYQQRTRKQEIEFPWDTFQRMKNAERR